MEERNSKIQKAASAGIAVNLILTAAKICAGFLGKSTAMLADGLHSLSDLIGDAIVIVSIWIGRLKPLHGKEKTIEKWASFIVSAILIGVAVELMLEGIESIREILEGQIAPKPGIITLIVAAISILFQEALYRYTIKIGKEVGSPAVTANAWHHRADGISSLGVLLGAGGAIVLGNKWTVLDPLVCCVLSIVIAVIAIKTIAGMQHHHHHHEHENS